MPLMLGFQTKYILNSWSMSFNPAKVLLMAFAVLSKILSMHCATDLPTPLALLSLNIPHFVTWWPIGWLKKFMGNLNPISLDSSRFDYHFVVPSSEFVARLNVPEPIVWPINGIFEYCNWERMKWHEIGCRFHRQPSSSIKPKNKEQKSLVFDYSGRGRCLKI